MAVPKRKSMGGIPSSRTMMTMSKRGSLSARDDEISFLSSSGVMMLNTSGEEQPYFVAMNNNELSYEDQQHQAKILASLPPQDQLAFARRKPYGVNPPPPWVSFNHHDPGSSSASASARLYNNTKNKMNKNNNNDDEKDTTTTGNDLFYDGEEGGIFLLPDANNNKKKSLTARDTSNKKKPKYRPSEYSPGFLPILTEAQKHKRSHVPILQMQPSSANLFEDVNDKRQHQLLRQDSLAGGGGEGFGGIKRTMSNVSTGTTTGQNKKSTTTINFNQALSQQRENVLRRGIALPWVVKQQERAKELQEQREQIERANGGRRK